MESLLIKTLNSQDKSEELRFMEKLYNDDVNISLLSAQMEILQVLLKDRDYFRFDDIIVKIKELPNPEREIIKEVITLCKLILLNPPDLSNRTVRQSNPIEHQSFDCRTQSNIIELTIKFCQSNVRLPNDW